MPLHGSATHSRVLLASLSTLALALIWSPSWATVVYRSVQLDLDTLELPSARLGSPDDPIRFPLEPFSINAGDRLVLDFVLTGGALRVTDLGRRSVESLTWLLYDSPNGRDGYLWSTRVNFLGVRGPLRENGFTDLYAGPLGAHTLLHDLTRGSFVFDGVRLTFDITDNTNSDQRPFTSDVLNFYGWFLSEDESGRFARVPEPASSGLMLLAVITALACRSRRVTCAYSDRS